MAGRGSVRVEMSTEMPKEILDIIKGNEEQVARLIEADARATSEFIDKTGKLRRSIKAKPSKFPDGGFIVEARAPHAHLVEFGHGGPNPAPAHSYLRAAKEKVIGDAKRIFGVK
jgi:hypothetical protein